MLGPKKAPHESPSAKKGLEGHIKDGHMGLLKVVDPGPLGLPKILIVAHTCACIYIHMYSHMRIYIHIQTNTCAYIYNKQTHVHIVAALEAVLREGQRADSCIVPWAVCSGALSAGGCAPMLF